MSKLIAKYNLMLSAPLLIKNSNGNDVEFKISIEDYSVTIRLLVQTVTSFLSDINCKDISLGVNELEVIVGKNREYLPPSDAKEQIEYKKEVIYSYANIAQKAVNRLIQYFKYELGNPGLCIIPDRKIYFIEPKWVDGTDREIQIAFGMFECGVPRQLIAAPDFGVSLYDINNDISSYLSEDKEYPLALQLLSDAKTAVFEKSNRRAVMEMAIACEIIIKESFFGQNLISAKAQEYLEDKGRASLSIIEYIGPMAKYVFGESYKDFNEDDFNNIDYLFRCRNKVAHRGVLYFNDTKGNQQPVDEQVLKKWWKSIELMIDWLRNKTG